MCKFSANNCKTVHETNINTHLTSRAVDPCVTCHPFLHFFVTLLPKFSWELKISHHFVFDRFELRHIMAISSHKSETTVKTYTKKCPDPKKCEMSAALSNKMLPVP